MKPLKPRDKVTQRMTRDGLTLDNQTTGESVNVSSREAEQEYSAAEPGGAAEKVLERAGDIRDRRKAKRAAKDAGDVVTEAGEALHRPSSRLQFTAEERADPQLSKYIHKAEKKADKLNAAKDALPKKRVVTTETVYDEASGRAKTKLRFDKVEKPTPKLKPNPMSRPVQEAGLFVHGKIHEVEGENVGVEGGHKGEKLAERQAGKAIRSGIRRHKLKPYRAAAKAERKSIAANAEYIYQKSLRDNPELAQAVSNPVSRFWQKQKIKRDYARAARAAGQTAQGAAGAATKTAQASAAAAKKAAQKSEKAASFVARHWKGALLIGGVGLMLMLIMGGLQSCTAMFGSAGTGLAATSYLSEDDDMLGAEAAYADLEADLQHELDNYESLHPGYDEYRFDLDEIGHDPYVLTSILSALHEGVYTLGDVQGDLAMLFADNTQNGRAFAVPFHIDNIAFVAEFHLLIGFYHFFGDFIISHQLRNHFFHIFQCNGIGTVRQSLIGVIMGFHKYGGNTHSHGCSGQNRCKFSLTAGTCPHSAGLLHGMGGIHNHRTAGIVCHLRETSHIGDQGIVAK